MLGQPGALVLVGRELADQGAVFCLGPQLGQMISLVASR